MLRLVRRLSEKDQKVLSGVEIALSLADTYEHVAQYACGEVMAYPRNLAENLRQLYSDRKLRCKVCDPGLAEKIVRVSGDKVEFLTLGETMIAAAMYQKALK